MYTKDNIFTLADQSEWKEVQRAVDENEINGIQCPTCESPEPRLHPSLQADGGEVYKICPDDFHKRQ